MPQSDRPAKKSTSPQIAQAVVGETLDFAVDFSPLLRRSNEIDDTLSGTPTVEEQTTSDLDIANIAKNSNVERILGVDVAANKAVTFTVADFVAANFPYTLKITFATSAGATRIRYVKIADADSEQTT